MKTILLDSIHGSTAAIPLSLALGAAPTVQNALISLVSSALVALTKHLFQKRRARRAARKLSLSHGS